ncbi:MAG: GtrA family protein [Lachnospiraceae bacterium]|nr:GtrA family protein [Lachnospiraceae bacterium]MCR5023069.1 GtrA family protein [Lachnospiraceae bacterium]
MSSLIKQILKFGVVGGLSFLIDFAIYTLIIVIFGNAKTTVAAAAFFGFTISLIFNYFTSMKFVFVHDENMDRRKEFTIFAVLSLIGLVLNEVLILGVLAVFDNVAFLQTGFSGLLWRFKETIGKIFATGVVMVYNFITRKIFIEKKN